MRPVPFTQYLRPNGRAQAVQIDRPDDIADMAKAIVACGFRFECEELMNGICSFTIADDNQDYAIELCPNGPGVPDSVDKLIRNFDLAAACEKKKRLEN